MEIVKKPLEDVSGLLEVLMKAAKRNLERDKILLPACAVIRGRELKMIGMPGDDVIPKRAAYSLLSASLRLCGDVDAVVVISDARTAQCTSKEEIAKRTKGLADDPAAQECLIVLIKGPKVQTQGIMQLYERCVGEDGAEVIVWGDFKELIPSANSSLKMSLLPDWWS